MGHEPRREALLRRAQFVSAGMHGAGWLARMEHSSGAEGAGGFSCLLQPHARACACMDGLHAQDLASL